MVICLECGANDLHMVQLMPLPPIISCFSKIQNGLPFWCWLTRVVLEKRPLNVCVCNENEHFNISVTSRELQTSCLGLVSKFKRLVLAGEANVSVLAGEGLSLVSVLNVNVLCPSLSINVIRQHKHENCQSVKLSFDTNRSTSAVN